MDKEAQEKIAKQTQQIKELKKRLSAEPPMLSDDDIREILFRNGNATGTIYPADREIRHAQWSLVKAFYAGGAFYTGGKE